VLLQAQVDPDSDTFSDLIGGCTHARDFGELEPLSLGDHARLIRAALRAWSAPGPVDDPPSEATG
jgi:hypothetical protein